MTVYDIDLDFLGKLMEELETIMEQLDQHIEYLFGSHLEIKNHFDPVVKEGVKLEYPISVELYDLYKYVRGEKEKTEAIVKTIDNIEYMSVNHPIFQYEIDINWSKFKQSYLGTLISIAMCKTVYDEKEDLNPREVSELAGVTPNAIRIKIKRGKIKARKEHTQYQIPYSEYSKIVPEKLK